MCRQGKVDATVTQPRSTHRVIHMRTTGGKRPVSLNLELAAFLVARTIEALTHAAVVHYPELLDNDQFVNEATEMLQRYLRRD